LILIVYVDYHQHMVDPRRWRALPVILAATFLYGFDLNVVNIALASLQRDLHAGSAALELVVGGYAFTYAAGLVTGGRLGDLFGYRRMFTAGMASFAIASLLCGLAQSPGELVGARLLQGLAAAVMVPQVLAMITALFPGEERPRALAWFGVTAGVSGLCGQVLGGLLLSANVLGLSWRAIFFLNVPIGALVLVLASRLVPKVATPAGTRMDPCGVAGISAALALALAPLSLGQQEGWPAWTWACLAASLPVMAAALAWEQRLDRRGGQPLIDLSLFGRRSFTAAWRSAWRSWPASPAACSPSVCCFRTGSGSPPCTPDWPFSRWRPPGSPDRSSAAACCPATGRSGSCWPARWSTPPASPLWP
jgi:MFS family permease